MEKDMYHVNIGFRSDRGRKRDRDEDSLAVVHMQAIYESKGAQSVLLVVADGMGGHRAGEVASQLAVQGLITTLTPDLVKEPPQDICALMASAIEGINRTLLDHVQAHPDYHGMGTTITSAVIIRGIDAFRIFVHPLALGVAGQVPVLASFAYNEYTNVHLTTSAAASVILLLMILVAVVAYLRLVGAEEVVQ